MTKRIRYKSGAATGMIATLEDTEAENALATGFAELAPEEPPAEEAAAEPEPEAEEASRRPRRRAPKAGE